MTSEITAKRKELSTKEDWDNAIIEAIRKYDEKGFLSDVLFWNRAIIELEKFSKEEGKKEARKDELYFLTHLFDNKVCPDGNIIDMGLIISSVSPFAILINSRIEKLKQSLTKSEGGKEA